MRDLIQELIPHAPHLGLYVAPAIPEDKLRNALDDYAGALRPEEALALFDATLMGSARDGAVFAADRFVFQNNNLEPAHEVRYEDLVQVDKKRGFLKGAKVCLSVNRGRATFDLTFDCSGKPEALAFLYRFLHEAMLRPEARLPEADVPRTAAGSDLQALRNALDALRADGRLVEDDYRRILDALS